MTHFSGFKQVLLILFFCLAAGSVSGQEDYPIAYTDTSSPRATMKSFMKNCKVAYDQIQKIKAGQEVQDEERVSGKRILRCLDLSEIPPTLQIDLGRESAVCLKEILDRIELPEFHEIPDAAGVAEEKITQWKIDGTDLTIVQLKEGPRTGEFVFSPNTINNARDYYHELKELPYLERGEHDFSGFSTSGFYNMYLSQPGWMISIKWLPKWSQERYWGQAIWQWTGFILVCVLGIVSMSLIYFVGRAKAIGTLKFSILIYLGTILFPISAMCVPLIVDYLISNQIRITGYPLIVNRFFCNFIFLGGVIVVVISASNRVTELIISSPKIHPKGLDAQLIRLIARIVSFILAAIIVLEGGRQLGIPLTTLVAGAGVGGLTLALAAQDTLKNVFGSVMILLDKPFRVGERIAFKGYDGVVEEIGLRSTKIRLLSGHLAAISNEELARSDIENIGRRQYIRRTGTVCIPIFTVEEKVSEAVQIIKEILDHHEGMKEDRTPKVYLKDVQRDAFEIQFIYWYHPPDYWDYMEFGQKVNLEIIKRFSDADISFALPTNVTQFAPGSHAEQSNVVVQKMQSEEQQD